MGISSKMRAYNLFIFRWLQVLNSLNLVLEEGEISEEVLKIPSPRLIPGMDPSIRQI